MYYVGSMVLSYEYHWLWNYWDAAELDRMFTEAIIKCLKTCVLYYCPIHSTVVKALAVSDIVE